MKKLLIAAIVIIVVLIAAAVLLLFSNLDKLVAKGIEKYGSEATGTRVSVSGVHISLREGRGSIRGLRVASPDGFKVRTVLALEGITVAVDIKSVREDPIVIGEIRIKAPVVNAEITKTGDSNIEELRKHVKARAGASGGERGDSGTATKKLRVERFVFEEGRIEVDATALGLEKKTIVLPEIRLHDVGGAGGAAPEEIAAVILKAVAGKATSEIAGSEVDRLIKERLGGSTADKAKGLIEKILK
jgi:uncharacterized protein involved in outer membrane biogenesis